ncbi:aromatic ring-hydroxylating dioxygenase subunit alpha [uncultured Cocleimonas sp.]|uniref:aromatic ring-hydroxylating oxygenase subunit alpha n=1 Tax=uncultured Cocleimonas sp. TaxID=1051587 RepID=UPI0026237FCD|nr:aromatic ring-hydroxylating dioxygenase subunit alpha [uncultured Cocleimonas sp.]
MSNSTTHAVAFIKKASLTNIDDVLKPIEEARGLPNEHYTSNEVYEEEKQQLIFNNWAGLDVGNSIPNAGDAKPVDFFGMPLLIIRDRDGSIGVFQNTCRHRGMILVKEPTKIRGVISCPYHGWCYGTKGDLRATPHVGGVGENTHESIKNEDLGLFAIRSHVWKDIIFVNVSGDAPEFEEYAGDLLERWKEFDQPIYHGGDTSSFTMELKCNWKLAVENYSESYHLPFIHPDLNSYSRIEDHYNIDEAEGYSGQGTTVYQRLKSDDGKTLPEFSDLSSKWDEGAEYVTLFPNVILGIHRDHFFTMLLQPLGPQVTVEYTHLYYPSDPKDMPENDTIFERNAGLWKQVFSEDIQVVEGMQESRHGQFFDGGKFSPAHDGPTHRFHTWVAKTLKASREQEVAVAGV